MYKQGSDSESIIGSDIKSSKKEDMHPLEKGQTVDNIDFSVYSCPACRRGRSHRKDVLWWTSAVSVYRLSFMFFLLRFKQVPSNFSYLGECCNAFLLWSSRNVLRSPKLHLTFHQHKGKSFLFSVFFFFFGGGGDFYTQLMPQWVRIYVFQLHVVFFM